MSDALKRFLDGEYEPLEGAEESDERPYASRDEIKYGKKQIRKRAEQTGRGRHLIRAVRNGFYRMYNVVAVVSCVVLIGVLLYTIANLPRYGEENPRTTEVVERYIESGLEETGAVNIVAGMILDYRAFDTLGESHVLFTALICVLILLRIDSKNMRRDVESYYQVSTDRYFNIAADSIMRRVGMLLVPCIFLYGIYVLLNGQNSPGGGFSGGTVLGSGLIIFTSCYGFNKADRILNTRRINLITLTALSFYSFAKGYVFFTGANGIENHIPKGTPGAILSGGLILPLDIAVGIVVCCTMYGLYSLFKRGNIGHD